MAAAIPAVHRPSWTLALLSQLAQHVPEQEAEAGDRVSFGVQGLDPGFRKEWECKHTQQGAPGDVQKWGPQAPLGHRKRCSRPCRQRCRSLKNAGLTKAACPPLAT